MNDNTTKRNFLLILVAYLAFISLGLPDGLLGISWPFLSLKVSVPLESLGILLISFVAGYLCTSTTTGKILSHLPLGVLLTLSCFMTGLCLLAFGFSNYWILVVIASFFLGSGGGAIDTSINTFAASRFSPSVVNWLHAFYGMGATAGPFIITWMLVHDKQWSDGYVLVGLIQIALSVVFLVTLRYWKVSGSREAEESSVSYAEVFRLPMFCVTILIFFFYTGLEVGVGQWIFTILTESRSIDTGRAGAWTSAYWGSLTAGRIIFGFILTRFSVNKVLMAAFMGIIVGAFLVAINGTELHTLMGIILIGVSNAPVFPCLISITPRQVGDKHSATMIGFQISAALVGGALLPAFAGFSSGYFGWEVIPLLFLIEAIMLLTFYLISFKGKVKLT